MIRRLRPRLVPVLCRRCGRPTNTLSAPMFSGAVAWQKWRAICCLTDDERDLMRMECSGIAPVLDTTPVAPPVYQSRPLSDVVDDTLDQLLRPPPPG